MWRLAQNSNEVKPDEIDKTSSPNVVYIRKDFEELERTDEEGNVVGTYWQYQENAIPKKDWELYEMLVSSDGKITDVELALCDVYEMITK